MLFSMILLNSCTQYIMPITGMNIEVRVLLAKKHTLKLFPQDSYILTIGNKSAITSGNLNVQYTSKGLKINNINFAVNSLDVQGLKFFQIDNKIYRGRFTIYKENGQLQLVNKLHLEEYLLSVIPSEIYSSWSKEALKAQAVASRTYALYEIMKNRRQKHKHFDLYADTRSQMYDGIKTETPQTTKAVLATAGQVLTYHGTLIKAYYSSSIGGKSANGSEIGDNKPYLQSVNAPAILEFPAYYWVAKIPLKKLQKYLKTKGSIKSIKISERTLSGRIKKIQIQDNFGDAKIFNGEQFRSKIGQTTMKSTLAGIQVNNAMLTIKGRGYGHGVGMGQWEAQNFAQRGKTYTQILSYFYQGTKISEIY